MTDGECGYQLVTTESDGTELLVFWPCRDGLGVLENMAYVPL